MHRTHYPLEPRTPPSSARRAATARALGAAKGVAS